MTKFLIQGTYTAEGAKGLMKEGGTGRKAAVQKAVEGLGGKLESIYYTLGASDVIVVCDMPDATSGFALSLAVNASGAVRISRRLFCRSKKSTRPVRRPSATDRRELSVVCGGVGRADRRLTPPALRSRARRSHAIRLDTPEVLRMRTQSKDRPAPERQ